MLNPSSPASVRILPNNKVYRQLFDAQVQLSDAYNRVRKNQLSKSVNITTQPASLPLIRNIKPHETQKRRWLTSMSYSDDSSINPVKISFHDELKRRHSERLKQLDETKREVFNLPDVIEPAEIANNEDSTDAHRRGHVTERLASNRQTKYNELWKEFQDKIVETNHNLLIKLEDITRQCNAYYEGGDNEINKALRKLIYEKDIASITIESFDNASAYLKQYLAPRLEKIQEYCQEIEELELERIEKIRDLFKYYSERLYKTHNLPETEIAYQLERQANELNTQMFENRRTYADLEARLLTGETVRMHRYESELHNYQNKWRDEIWIIHEKTWTSKLNQCEGQLESTILSTCASVGSEISALTYAFISHLQKLNSFVPPTSTCEYAKKWYNLGQDIINKLVNTREQLVVKLKDVVNDEIHLLEKESQNIREKIRNGKVYHDEQINFVFARDIDPLFEERKKFLQESVVDRFKASYEKSTDIMVEILDRLYGFIQPAAEQWDDHQNRLEQTNAQLLNMIQEYRRPFDSQNEKKLTKLDATLDELRCASNETALSRLLNSSYEQLDALKAGFVQFYDAEHSIVNKYADMVAVEVNRYKNEMLNYFHAQPIGENPIDDNNSPSSQYYTTSLTKTTYELEGYVNCESDVTRTTSSSGHGERSRRSSTRRTRRRTPNMLPGVLKLSQPDDSPMQTFITGSPILNFENWNLKILTIPFYDSFEIPSNLADSLIFNLCRSFLDRFDHWNEETKQRTNAVMFSKHEELDKESDFQMHLHEPRRVRIEIDIHNVRAAELVMHDERVERHIRGVQEALEQTDADYGRMLKEFNKSISTYRDDIFALEEVFVNATTSNRLTALQDRLGKQRDGFMSNIRGSLRDFRKGFDDVMQYLRQANIKFRKSFKLFSEGGNFSREEIEIYRKKLEKTMYQIDKAETAILTELEKLEKKQLEEANKIMNQFQERFKNHMTDLKFIELTNRWISEAQVKIKSEVGVSNQNAQIFKANVLTFQVKIDSILNPNLDKQLATSSEIREMFHQIVLMTYERALYLKCLNNELAIPASLFNILKDKGLVTEKELIKDLLHVSITEESSSSRRPSRVSVGMTSMNEDVKSVKFASASSPTTSTSRNKTDSAILINLTGGHPEDLDTISTIRSLLHPNEQKDSDEVVEPGVPAAIELATRLNAADSAPGKKPKQTVKKENSIQIESVDQSLTEDSTPGTRLERPSRARTRDEIYRLYCTFGEKKHTGQDFMSKIANILRDSIEGLLTHSELYYREKGNRPVTRPQILREKFEEFALLVIEKLKNYEEQCRSYHESSINEFRNMLELFERVSSLMVKIEFNEQTIEAEKLLLNFQQEFHQNIAKKLNESNTRKEINFQQLRPTFGDPAKKDHLLKIDNQEKLRQSDIEKIINELKSNTIKNLKATSQTATESLAKKAESLLITFDEILTADEITRTKIPIVKKSLSELVKLQQAGKSLEDAAPTPLVERKQGRWPGLPLLDDQLNQKRESNKSKKLLSASTQKQTTSAAIVTQKTTLPQIETISQRDQAYQKYRELFIQVLADIEATCSTSIAQLERDRSYWNTSISELQQIRTV